MILRRWLAIAVIGLVAFLYYRPLTRYVETRREAAQAAAEIRALEAERARLEQRLTARSSTDALVREARRLAYVQPGERLFIVKGIPEWRRARQDGPQERATIGGDG
ncbi:MAG: septum formation initiator family protein [Gaiellaceae bacterium]